MKKLIFFLLTLILTLKISAFSNKNHKILHLKKINTKIKIDGIIDPIWSQADSAVNFIEFSPYYDTKPGRKTVAKILSTNDALYVLIIAYDKKQDIQRFTGMLDNFSGDFVSIMLDTFDDNRTAYKFIVSANGVRGDARLLDDGRNRDYNWNGIWFAAAKTYKWGYVVEMKIPYKSIQYDEKLNKWGIDFDRWIPKLHEDIYWSKYKQSEGLRVSKFGEMIFDNFKPHVKGLNMEIYPVGLTKAEYMKNNKYNMSENAGLDIFYNPSSKLTFQLTANPDFAQIEADPYNFNISRYESYYSERRPFFTEGSEVFSASGKQRNMGFYRPLQLFYSRRIGKKLPDGSLVPLIVGTKVFGRINKWEYGGFFALTGKKNYMQDGTLNTEPQADFAAVRIKKQIFGNSSIGMLFVGKHNYQHNYGVLDIDGAFRKPSWQLAYQVARSFKDSKGDYAVSAGFTNLTNTWLNGVRFRYIGNKFDVEQIGFVPWKGTTDFTTISGPRWVFKNGAIKSIMLLGGVSLDYTVQDAYTDRAGGFVFNMQFRNNWGFEIDAFAGKSKDLNVKYTSYSVNFSSWFNVSPKWNGNLYGGYSKTYNFARGYLSFYSWMGAYISWKALNSLSLGTSFNAYIEGNPSGNIEEITYNSRPYVSFTPMNNLNIRIYLGNVFLRSTGRLEQLTSGFLFSYNFLPKSWIYLAINDLQDRSPEYNSFGVMLPPKLHTIARVAVFKVKYLYYF